MTTLLSVCVLSRDAILSNITPLCDILENSVNGGASVSFMLPFARDKATAFWQKVAHSVAANERIVLAAFDAQKQLQGTVQLVIEQPENQEHRADVAKLLVHDRARRQGIARLLMSELEKIAAQHGKSVLVLDTATGSSAETFYTHCGWQRVGEIPRYALMPDGEMTSTTVFYKFLPFFYE